MTLPLDIQTPGTVLVPGNETGRVHQDGEALGTRPALNVVGLDLSLTSTGIASRQGAHTAKPPSQLKGFARMRWIRAVVLGHLTDADLVVVEAPAYSSSGKYAKENAGLWHVVMIAVDVRGIRWIDVMSNSVKKYATGKGRAIEKDAMVIAAVKRLPINIRNNDEADAAWLCAMGHDLLGEPIVQMPAVNRTALDAVRARLDFAGAHV